MTLKSVRTRFRAYRLDTAGASFSYFANSHFTLIEARYTEENKKSIALEMHECGVDLKKGIETLHITSWDQDHCVAEQLNEIMVDLRPRVIEYPGHDPDKQNATESLKLIKEYKKKFENTRIRRVSPSYINGLNKAKNYGYEHTLHHPKKYDDNPNNNSLVKLFRTGSFNALSLGDLEGSMLSSAIASSSTICNEMDIMILAHHGADNDFTTGKLLKQTKPKLAIAAANLNNQYGHPHEEIVSLLEKQNIPLFITGNGDIIVRSIEPHQGDCKVIQLDVNGKQMSEMSFEAKKTKKVQIRPDNRLAILNRRKRP